MKRTIGIAMIVLGDAWWVLGAGAAPPATQPATKPATQPAKEPVKPPLKYLLSVPKEYGQGKQRWPLMLFLHGAGERGDNLDLVRKHGPPKLIAAGKEYPFIVVSPQCPKDIWWSSPEMIAALDGLLKEVVAKYAVDADRVIVTGLSMGGFGTWALAAAYSDRFAAIVPICGMGDPETAERIKHIPTWVFHGAKDPVVPIKGTRKFPNLELGKNLVGSQDMVDALKAAGGSPKFTAYPDAKHDSWTAAYETKELYDWMLAQRRGGKS